MSRFRSLRSQLFLAVGVITLAGQVALAVLMVHGLRARATAFAQRAAEDDARVVAALSSRAVEMLGVSLARGAKLLRADQLLFGFTRNPGDTRVQILDERGAVLFDSLREQERFEPAAMVEASADIVRGGKAVGRVRVYKASAGMREVMQEALPGVAAVALLTWLASALVAVLVGGWLVEPIARLTRTAERVASGERQAPLPRPRGREVRALTQAFESMRRELEQRKQMESFVSALSHQLKNPIAAIRAAAEVVVEGADDPETSRQFGGRIDESAQRLSALVTDMLALTRLEAGSAIRPDEEVELAELTAQAAASLASLAEQRGVRLERAGSAQARCDAVWVVRAIENLMHNALVHSPPNGTVEVRIDMAASAVEIVVSDQGPGVSAAMRPRLFEPFATTRSEDGGTGLGLAIVRAVAEAHGGRAELRGEGEGARFVLVLPGRGE